MSALIRLTSSLVAAAAAAWSFVAVAMVMVVVMMALESQLMFQLPLMAFLIDTCKVMNKRC